MNIDEKLDKHDKFTCNKCKFVSKFEKSYGFINFWIYCDDYVPTGHCNISKLTGTQIKYTPISDGQYFNMLFYASKK